MRFGWTIPTVALSVFIGVPAARGQAPTASTSEEGRAEVQPSIPAANAFDKGVILYKQGKFVEASDAFREAYRLRPSWRLLYNLGQSEAAAKRLGIALEAFEEYLAKGGDEVEASRAEEIRAEILRMRDLVGYIEIKAPAGADVVVDNVVRGRCPLPGVVPVTAGVVHSVSTVKDGVASAAREVKVSGGQTSIVDFNAVSTPVGVAEAQPVIESAKTMREKSPSEVRPVGRGIRVFGWAMTGIGAAFMLGAVGTGAAALVLDDDIEGNCPGGVCDASWADELQTRDRLAVTTNVLLGVGSAALIAGGIALMVMKKGKKENQRLSFYSGYGTQGTGTQFTWHF